MTSLNNPTIDLDALMVALAHQSEPLPSDLQQQLSHAGQALVDNQPHAAQTLRGLVRSYPPLETAYLQVLRQWDNDYTTQERAKSLTATFHTNQGIGFLFSQDVLSSSDWVSATRHLSSQSPTSTQPDSIWSQVDRLAIMAAGGAFLGGAIVQLFGGGSIQLIGALIGAIVGAVSGWYVTPRRSQP
jgi:hypothetical protein